MQNNRKCDNEKQWKQKTKGNNVLFYLFIYLFIHLVIWHYFLFLLLVKYICFPLEISPLMHTHKFHPPKLKSIEFQSLSLPLSWHMTGMYWWCVDLRQRDALSGLAD